MYLERRHLSSARYPSPSSRCCVQQHAVLCPPQNGTPFIYFRGLTSHPQTTITGHSDQPKLSTPLANKRIKVQQNATR